MPKNPWEMTPEEMAAATKPKANATKNPWEMSEAEMANATKLAGPAPEAQPDITPDEFGNFIQTGKLPAGRKTVKELRSMPRGLIQTKEDLATAYGIDPAKMSQYDLTDAFQKFQSEANNWKPSGVVGTFFKAVKKGVTDPLRGTEQAISRGFADMIPDSPGLQSSANLSDLNNRIYSDQYMTQSGLHPTVSAIGQGIGQAPYALLTPTAPILGAASKVPGVLKAGAGGAAFGFSQPISDPNQSRLGNTLTGAVMAPIGQVGFEGGVTALSKLHAALPGGKLPAQYDSLQKEIRAAGMEPTAADLVSSPTSSVGKLRDIISNAPFGNFTAQNEANKIAAGQTVRNMVTGTKQNMLNQPISGLSELQAAADAGNDQAKLFLSRIQSQGTSPGRNLQADLDAQEFIRQGVVNDKFDARLKFDNGLPSDTKGVRSGIDKVAGEAELLGTNAPKGVLPYLKGVIGDLQPPVKGVAPKFDVYGTLTSEGVSGSAGGVMGKGTYSQLEKLLRGIKQKQRTLLDPSSEMGTDASNYITKSKNIVKNRLREIEALPGNEKLAAATQDARATASELMGPFKDESVATLRGDTKPDIAASMLSGKSPEEMKIIQSALGPRGRAASFHAIVDDIATEAATNRVSPEFQFQRGVFLDKLKAAKGALGEVATPLEKSQVDSIERVMQHMDQLDKTEFKAPNYTRWIWSQPNVLLKPLLTTDWGKRMLLTLSASKVGSATERSVLQAIEQKIPQFMAMGQDHNSGNPINDIPVEPIE